MNIVLEIVQATTTAHELAVFKAIF